MKRINKLIKKYPHLPELKRWYLNKRDIALLVEHEKQVIGFLWCGLMANKRIGYIDHYTIDPFYSKQGVSNTLAKAFLEECQTRKIETTFAVIGQHKYHNQSLVGAFKLGMKKAELPCTFVYKGEL